MARALIAVASIPHVICADTVHIESLPSPPDVACAHNNCDLCAFLHTAADYTADLLDIFVIDYAVLGSEGFAGQL